MKNTPAPDPRIAWHRKKSPSLSELAIRLAIVMDEKWSSDSASEWEARNAAHFQVVLEEAGIVPSHSVIRPHGCNVSKCQGARICGHVCSNSYLVCTLLPGHEGDHIACGKHDHNVGRWPNSKPPKE